MNLKRYNHSVGVKGETVDLEERIESLERELADHDITITLIKDRIRDMEETIKQNKLESQQVTLDLIKKIRAGISPLK